MHERNILVICSLYCITESRGVTFNTRALCLGNPAFEFRLGNLL
jgi:hypothetical protein